MKKFTPLVFVCLVGVILLAVFWNNNQQENSSESPTSTAPGNVQNAEQPVDPQTPPVEPSSSTPSSGRASFAIFTNNTFRIFTASMYHFQSQDVYISPDNPNIVQFTQSTTWQEFFDTLPFSVSKTCLITGTGQKFCNTDSEQLFFYLNEVETADALEQTIKPEDSLLITYGNLNHIDLDAQLLKASFSNTIQPDN